MKNFSELRMKGRAKDLVIAKKTEIVYATDESSDELLIYLLTDENNNEIRIQVHQRMFVNYFIIDTESTCQRNADQRLKVDNERRILLTSTPLKELILHMLKLKDFHDQEVQSHYVDIICRFLDAELAESESCPSSGHSKHKTMEKLRDYIDNNIKHSLSVKSLIDVCHMSERSLYYLFRESESMTPLSYVQQRKIVHVHRELSARKSSRSITQVAMEYGFTNLGRFSQLYRKQVGELPSVTRSKTLGQALQA
ncbi:helix-turn-helix domain-containing protein [Amphritea sp.]|uniref:AraC family transcriptional regulator n=1 Tax=Amphritea sp. TaxID=1872502 RepID=UPI003A91BDAD